MASAAADWTFPAWTTCTETAEDARRRRTAEGFTCDEVHMLELEGDPDRFGKQEDAAAGLRQQVQVELHGV